MSSTDATPAPGTQPVVAAFDLDGTLTTGGSVFPFLIRTSGLFNTLINTAIMAPRLLHAAVAGGHVADDTKEQLFMRLLHGMHESELDRLGAQFARLHVRHHLRPEMKARLDWHQALGHTTVIVSASPEVYVKHIAQLLGVDGICATRLAVGGGGIVSGHYEGKNCRGTEKYARLSGWLRSQGFPGAGEGQPMLWCYGNSRGDIRLLDAADYPVDAGRLGRFGKLRRFPRLSSLATPTAAAEGPALNLN